MVDMLCKVTIGFMEECFTKNDSCVDISNASRRYLNRFMNEINNLIPSRNLVVMKRELGKEWKVCRLLEPRWLAGSS